MYLDADTVVVSNIDELLTLPLPAHPPFAAAPDVFPPDRFNAGLFPGILCALARLTLVELFPVLSSLRQVIIKLVSISSN